MGKIIRPIKSKFTAEDWAVIKTWCEGWVGCIHHCLGKQYEKLGYLKLMTTHDHTGRGHSKYMTSIPLAEVQENLEAWRRVLRSDYAHFVNKNLLADFQNIE